MRRLGSRTAWLGLACAVSVSCGAVDATPTLLGSRSAALELGTVRWEQRSVALPPARMAHALIYDAGRELTLAVGGRPVNDFGDSLSDTWAWNGDSWSELSAGFPARGFIQGVFDSTRSVSVIYGGLDQTPSSSYAAETWERDTGVWSDRSGTPGQRSTGGLAFDSARGVSILFGGFDGTWLSGIFEWNGSTWTQRCTAAPCSTSPRPSRRAGMVFTYDAARQRTLMFGGYDGTSGDDYLGDTWTWDGDVWTLEDTPTAPSARVSAAAAYDPATAAVYLFGGTTGTEELRDLWAWDGSAWQLVQAQAAPSRRRDARLAWDTERRRGVLFGGRSSSQQVDFWELSLVGNACVSDDECHTGFCDGSVCIDAPVAPSDPPDAGQGGASSSGSAGTGGAPGPGGSESGSGGTADTSAGGTGNVGSAGAIHTGAASNGASGTVIGPDAGDLSSGAELGAGAKSLYACTTSAATARHGGLTAFCVLGCSVLLARRRRAVRRSAAPRRLRAPAA